jgi:hypothetical protein
MIKEILVSPVRRKVKVMDANAFEMFSVSFKSKREGLYYEKVSDAFGQIITVIKAKTIETHYLPFLMENTSLPQLIHVSNKVVCVSSSNNFPIASQHFCFFL